MSPNQIVLAFFELLNNNRRAILTTELVSPDAMWWSNGSEKWATRSGYKCFSEQATSYLNTSGTYKVNERLEILDIIADGNGKFAVELLVTAQGVEGQSTAEKTYVGHMVVIIIVREGQIVELREHKDNLAGMIFLGTDVVSQEGKT